MAAASTSPPKTKMGSSSPSSKKSAVKTEEPAVKPETSAAEKPSTTTQEASAEPKTATAGPLAPPPKPAATEGGDYFSQNHSTSNPFNLESNPFEASFSNPLETPGRTILPPVANITSPSPLPGITPGWQSLRAGPLSPAMLTGPTSQTDYFSESFRGFPTPNESSLRTGLTPGGGGSMFPAPSPNTQAIFNLQSGGVTPSTADFQQSALRAAAQAQKVQFPTTSAPTSQPDTATAGMERSNGFQPPASGQSDPYANHDVSNAANDLLSFATQNGNARNGAAPFGLTSQPPQAHNPNHMPVQPVTQDNGRRNTKGSINSISNSADTGDFSDSGHSEAAKANTRSSRGKKGATNGKPAAGNKRKAEEMPKGNSRKKTNGSAAAQAAAMDMEEDSEDDTSPKPEDGRKMTDEEKRKNFLERNRVAALKCRQRKKQWLANLQAKVELFSTENDALSATVTQLREEIVNLKTLLLAHKDCPVSHAQGLSGMNMNSFLGGEPTHQNPYGIAGMPSGVQMGMPMQAGNQINRYVYPRVAKTEDEENAPFPQNPYLPVTS